MRYNIILCPYLPYKHRNIAKNGINQQRYTNVNTQDVNATNDGKHNLRTE